MKPLKCAPQFWRRIGSSGFFVFELNIFRNLAVNSYFQSVVCMKNTRTAKGRVTYVGFNWLQILHRRFTSSPSGWYLIGWNIVQSMRGLVISNNREPEQLFYVSFVFQKNEKLCNYIWAWFEYVICSRTDKQKNGPNRWWLWNYFIMIFFARERTSDVTISRRLTALQKLTLENRKSPDPAGTQRCFNVHITLFGCYGR